MLVEAQQRLDLENHLRHALERDEMHLAYQPIVDAATGDVRSLEALLRWQHGQWGAVSPAQFTPIAEMSGTMVAVGEWVLRRACQDACNAAAEHGRAIGVSVNVSVRQLQSPHFVAAVASALEQSGLEPALLALEITESLLMDHDEPRRARARDDDLHRRTHPAQRRAAGRDAVRGVHGRARGAPGDPLADRGVRARHRAAARCVRRRRISHRLRQHSRPGLRRHGQTVRLSSSRPSCVTTTSARSCPRGTAVAPVTSMSPFAVGPQRATTERPPASSIAQAV